MAWLYVSFKYFFFIKNSINTIINTLITVGYKNLNKAPTPRVISIVEESIAKPRRPHARTIRPHQWHITRGGPTVEKKLWRGISVDMIEGVVAAPTFNASHQTS